MLGFTKFSREKFHPAGERWEVQLFGVALNAKQLQPRNNSCLVAKQELHTQEIWHLLQRIYHKVAHRVRHCEVCTGVESFYFSYLLMPRDSQWQ